MLVETILKYFFVNKISLIHDKKNNFYIKGV